MPIKRPKKSRALKALAVMVITIVLAVGTMWSAASSSQQLQQSIYEPHTHNGQKWRAAYILMDESSVYVNTFDNFLKGLISSGWLDVGQQSLKQYPQSGLEEMQTIALCDWFQHKAPNSYIDFVFSDYPEGLTTEKELDGFVKRVNKRLQDEKIDVAIIMGDEAAKRFKESGCPTKMMVLGTSDPVALGVAQNSKSSNMTNIWAHVDKEKYERQMQLFYNTFPFKRLGVIYDKAAKDQVKNTAEIEAIEKASKQFGFQVKYQDVEETEFSSASVKVKNIFEQMAGDVDAVYMMNYKGIEKKQFDELMDIFYKNHVYTFAETAGQVYKGMLMSATNLRDEGTSEFLTEIFCRILAEDNLRDIKQQYVAPPQMILNLDAAQKSSIDIDFEKIMTASQVIKK